MRIIKKEVSRARQVSAAVIGNTLEWYDFIVYGFMSSIIAKLFFPSDDPYSSLLMTMATFGIGFFMRPVGGVLIGLYADRKGRKAAMQLIVLLMTVAIALIAFAPTYAAFGIGAPALIVVARMLQGFAAGGEYASATAFLVESAPPGKRAFYGSWQNFGQCLAVFCGSGMGALITSFLSEDALYSWGWRVPFIVGLLIAPVGLWMRRNMEETHEFTSVQSEERHKPASLKNVIVNHGRAILVTMGLIICFTVSFYVILVNMPTFVSRQMGLPLDQAFIIQMLAVSVMTVIVPFAGMLSDKVGCRRVLLFSIGAFACAIYPLFSWLSDSPSLERFLVVQVVLCFCMAFFYGAMPTAVAELFPPAVRSTGLALSYNLSVMMFGGFAPVIVTWLTKVTGSSISPAYYVMFAASVAFVAAWFVAGKVAKRAIITGGESQLYHSSGSR